jgi:hypothetical protein
MNLASTTSALTSLSMAMPICSHCAREVTKIKRCSVCKIIYCSVKCQKKSWKTGGHRSTCKSPAMIANICYLMDKSSSRWIETLTMDEIFRLQMVSKTCTVMVNHGWVPYDVLIPRSYRKYSIKKINKQGEAWYSTIYIKRDTITNETLRNLWQSAGNQMRTLTLKNLPTISATGLAMLCEQPLLRELDLTNCTGINGTELMATFFVGTFSFPMLKDIKLSGVVGLTKEHLDVLHTRFGIISCDVFECQNCSQVSNEQAQCRFKHCQPSVLALCIDCADTMKCINIYCKGFGCGDCTGDYEDWTSCEACGVMSCEDCYEVRWCDGCEYSFCGKSYGCWYIIVLQFTTLIHFIECRKLQGCRLLFVMQ